MSDTQAQDKTPADAEQQPVLQETNAGQAGQATHRQQKRTARREARRLRRANRRETRKLRHTNWRAAYKALSAGKKLVRWIAGILLGLAALAIAGLLGYLLFSTFMQSYVEHKYQNSLSATAPHEEILLAAPLDPSGDKRIAATKPFDQDETWAIYVYICGSNLESMGRDRLSDTTDYYVEREKSAFETQNYEDRQRRFHTFIDEMQQSGMQLPNYLFLPADNDGGSEGNASDESSTQDGYATQNLRSMFEVALPENVSVVIQAGGSRDWSLSQVNPNASQRFLFNSDGLTELSSAYPMNMGSGQTLTEFLSYCESEHPADHKMLLFWNHGSGPFGFCNDEIYGGDCIKLAEMREALAVVYGGNPATPPFELVGYDACLMATTEVAEALYGYTRYLAASEETEMGDGWPYKQWLGELAAHPEMNGAQLGKVIADSFVESCANYSINMEWMQFEAVATFSVTDVEKAHNVYEAYTQLCAAALRDTAESPWPLGALGSAAEKSIRYAGSAYKYYNTVDLGAFMRNLSADYSEETAGVLRTLDEAVLYHRETSYAQGSEGLAVYFPTSVDSFYGLLFYLEYLDTVCTDPDMKALYYYKVAGCLNDELQAYAESAGYGAFDTLDTAPLAALAYSVPEISADGSIELPIGNEAAMLVQDLTLSVAGYDADTGELCFYGDDAYLYLDEYRTLRTTFDGSWAMLDGHILPLEIIDMTDVYIRYRVPIRYESYDNAYLIIAYDYNSGAYSVLGVQTLTENANTFGRNIKPVEIGSRMAVLYRMESMGSEDIYEQYGKSFTFRASSKVENDFLPDGDYFLAITISDTRGDAYYPPLVSFGMKGGNLSDMAVSEDMGVMAAAE